MHILTLGVPQNVLNFLVRKGHRTESVNFSETQHTIEKIIDDVRDHISYHSPDVLLIFFNNTKPLKTEHVRKLHTSETFLPIVGYEDLEPGTDWEHTLQKFLEAGGAYLFPSSTGIPLLYAALLASERNVNKKDVITCDYGDSRISVHQKDKMVEINGSIIFLSRKVYDVLLILARNKGRLVSPEKILSHITCDSPGAEPGADIVKVYIYALRKVLGKHGVGRGFIRTRYGFGYTIE